MLDVCLPQFLAFIDLVDLSLHLSKDVKGTEVPVCLIVFVVREPFTLQKNSAARSPTECFCQLKMNPLDHRKWTHLRVPSRSLIIENGPTCAFRSPV
jgi:hypothetical protein